MEKAAHLWTILVAFHAALYCLDFSVNKPHIDAEVPIFMRYNILLYKIDYLLLQDIK